MNIPAEKNTHRVSVVIPTHNRRAFVLEAVASVLAQTFAAFELIVVDDGSDDGTPEALAQAFDDPRLRVLRQERRGVSHARNRGADAATAPWLAFLDSDDLWKPEKLAVQIAHTEAEGHEASYTEEIWFRDGRWANPKNVHAKHSGDVFAHCLPLCLISPSSILMRASLYRELGGFDESLPACEDYDLWLRLSARRPVLLVPQRLIVKRNGHEGQLSQAHFGLDRFRVRALWKLVHDPQTPAEKKLQALAWIVRKSLVVAGGAAKRGEARRALIFDLSAEKARQWLETMER